MAGAAVLATLLAGCTSSNLGGFGTYGNNKLEVAEITNPGSYTAEGALAEARAHFRNNDFGHSAAFYKRAAELALFGMDSATLENSVAGAPWLWALGAWLGAPMRFWTIWLVGGLLVFMVARMIGARNTLPRFFAATGYAFLPLLLLVLLPVPIVGAVALVVALILFVLAYAQGVQVATQMEWGHVLIAMGLPIALLAILFVVFPALVLLFL